MKPVDLSFLEALASKPTLEEELLIEKRVLELKANHNIEDLRNYAIALERQNLHQTYFIATCLEQIAKLQGKLVANKYSSEKPLNLLSRLFKLF
tara:strand:+ start:404 stop:685 length:282 start_codon:yes stop_codon:yes gene_type:complete